MKGGGMFVVGLDRLAARHVSKTIWMRQLNREGATCVNAREIHLVGYECRGAYFTMVSQSEDVTYEGTYPTIASASIIANFSVSCASASISLNQRRPPSPSLSASWSSCIR